MNTNGLWDDIKGWGKKSLMAGSLAGALLFGAESQEVQAQEAPGDTATQVETIDDVVEEELPERDIDFNLSPHTIIENPLKNYEATTTSIYTASQAFGKLNDFLGVNMGLDENTWGRTGLALMALYTSDALSFYAHENGHFIVPKRRGSDITFPLTLSFRRSSVFPFFMIPDYKQELDRNLPKGQFHFRDYPEIENFREIADGPNIEEHDAEYQWRKNSSDGSFTFDEGAFYFRSKLGDVFSMVLGKESLGYEGPKEGSIENFTDILSYYAYEGRRVEDFNLMHDYMSHLRGVDMSKKEMLGKMLAADLLSYHTWESIGSIINYLTDGKRSSEITTMNIGGAEVVPPNITRYFTPRGIFYNIASVINPRSNPIEVSLGTDTDFIGHGKLNRLRAGMQYHNIGTDKLEVRPFAYLNSTRGFHPEGISLGTNIEYSIGNLKIKGEVEFNQGDTIENLVKGEGDIDIDIGARVNY